MPIRYLGEEIVAARILGGDVSSILYPLTGDAMAADGNAFMPAQGPFDFTTLPGVSAPGLNYDGAQVIYYDAGDNMVPAFFDGLVWAVPTVAAGTFYQLIVYASASDQLNDQNRIVTTSSDNDPLSFNFGVGDAVAGGSVTQAQVNSLIGISTANDLLGGNAGNRVYVIPNDHCTVTAI